MLRFGLRAHDFGPCGKLPESSYILAERIATYGVSCLQLALSKAFPDYPAQAGLMSPGFARGIRDIFAAQSLSIAVLGCYINPVHPDSDELDRQLRRFEEHLRFARDFGCAVVGTETGSMNPDCSWHPDTEGKAAFDALCVSVERLAKTAERCGAIVAIEPVADRHSISSIEKTKTLLERIDSPALGIIFDPVNLIPQAGLRESQGEFFERAFAAFGSRIVAVHIKDFLTINRKKSEIAAPGAGEFDFPAFFRLLQVRKPGVDVLMENTSPATAPGALAFVRRIAEESARTS